MLNKQPIEKRDLSKDGSVEVHSIFYTIQGEGPFCGTPAVFVRLAGCNLQCPGCDTEYTSKRTRMTPDEVTLAVFNAAPMRGLVVITGGEPFRQNLKKLISKLIWSGHYVQIETNGTLEPSPVAYGIETSRRKGAYIVCSPKTGKIHPRIYETACALKYVVEDGDVREEDGLPMTALRHTALPYPARPPAGWKRAVYIQPMDSKDEAENRANMAAALSSAKRFGYILQLQVHKYLGVE
jgi:organic radical activating enzyme